MQSTTLRTDITTSNRAYANGRLRPPLLITIADGRAILTCAVRPGRAHDAIRHSRTKKRRRSVGAIEKHGTCLLKIIFKALRNVGLSPWRIDSIAAAALVLPNAEYHRTT